MDQIVLNNLQQYFPQTLEFEECLWQLRSVKVNKHLLA